MSDKQYPSRQWPCYLGEPEVSGKIRVHLEDFQVQEIPAFMPSGEGNHLWLEIEKRGANTQGVAELLAKSSGASLRDIGYAGMKDRHGVTSQWFSISLQENPVSDWKLWTIPGVTVLQALKHPRKLKRGVLKGNRFRIVLRELTGNIAGLEQRFEAICALGVPNYFGPQRFGFGGSNIERGIRWLEHGGKLPRNKRSIYISAVRSYIFNNVLARRVEDGTWNQLLDGEIAMLDGSHSLFCCGTPDPALIRRAGEFDLHPTAPLAGTGGMSPQGEAEIIENGSLAVFSERVESLRKAGARADRRATRMVPGNLKWHFDGNALTVSFELPPGCYATTLLKELVSCFDNNHIPEA